MNVIIAIHRAASDFFPFSFPSHGIMLSLSVLLAFHFRTERGEREHDLVHRVVELPFPIFEIKEDTDSGVRNLFSGRRLFRCSHARVWILPT